MPAIFSTLAAGAVGLGTLVGLGGGAAAGGVAAAGARTEAQKKKEAQLKLKGEGLKASEYARGAPERAKLAAQEEVKKQRRIRELAGGRTILTSDARAGKTVLG